MGIFALLALFSGSWLISTYDWFEGADETDETDELESKVSGQSEEEADTGASFERTEDGVVIEVGEDETRSVVAIHFLDTQDDETDFIAIDEVRYYLVDEETDWSDASYENQHIVPGAEDYEGGSGGYSLDDFELSQGLELIGVVDVKGVPETDDPNDRVGTVVSNVSIESYYLEATTDSDDLVLFLPVDHVVTINGVAETSVFEDTSGTSGSDWFSADAAGITVSGLQGNDTLHSESANVLLDGGKGNDTLESAGDNTTMVGGNGNDQLIASGVDVTIIGGAGNDSVSNTPSVMTVGEVIERSAFVDLGAGDDNAHVVNSTVYGGTGDDIISGSSFGGEAILYGGAGEDIVSASGVDAVAHGGVGDDFVAAANGATAKGGAGNDTVQLTGGTTGYGGSGDDTFTYWEFLWNDTGPATIVTGNGSDTIDVKVRTAVHGEPDDIYLRVMDFDPEQDVLQIEGWSSYADVEDIEVEEAADGSYSDVRVTFESVGNSEPGVAVIRLEGTTGLSADQIVINP